MIVLDTLELIIETATEMGEVGNSISQIISCSLRVLLHIFSKRQSVSVLEHSFAVQRSIVAKVCYFSTTDVINIVLPLLSKLLFV